MKKYHINELYDLCPYCDGSGSEYFSEGVWLQCLHCRPEDGDPEYNSDKYFFPGFIKKERSPTVEKNQVYGFEEVRNPYNRPEYGEDTKPHL